MEGVIRRFTYQLTKQTKDFLFIPSFQTTATCELCL